jgi:1-deoxy-D-xylulose-5-phosphate synthase
MTLEKIYSPSDLKKLSLSELESLAKEIRTKIIEVMSVNGGHLGSNLGSVEFTLALHYVFSSPEDKFIWDVSHQAYTHKLMTGRKELFSTVRKYQGLSGFAHPGESLHDHLFAGHAGAAISSALGMAHARDLNKGEETIIPIIGDASLTCGLSLEALKNIKRSSSSTTIRCRYRRT